MRAPSDAQAAFLALVADHENAGLAVEWDTAGAHDGYRPSLARLYVERVDREKNTGRLEMVSTNRRTWHRVATVRACIRHGWLNDLHRRDIHLPKTEWYPRDRVLQLVQLDMLEDGVIALGLWRERKLKSPPTQLPVLEGADREVMELAARARALGYKLAPMSDDARAQARRLARDGWARRGFIGGSVSSVDPTPMAIVEVNPEGADVA